MNTLKSFLLINNPDSKNYACYTRLISDRPIGDIVQCLSQTVGANLDKADHFDECEAYLAVLGDHDLTLYPPSNGLNQFDIMIEPGHGCMTVGNSIDLSDKLAVWLNLKAAELGRFTIL